MRRSLDRQLLLPGDYDALILVHGYIGDFESNWPSVIDVLPHSQVIDTEVLVIEAS